MAKIMVDSTFCDFGGLLPMVKHLAGKHDQSSHGSWANSTKLSIEDVQKIVEFHQPINSLNGWREIFASVIHTVGKTRKPTFGNVDEVVQDGGTPVWRVFDAHQNWDSSIKDPKVTLNEKIKMFMEQETPYMSTGRRGVGLYGAHSQADARSWEQSQYEDSKTLKMALKKDAKILVYPSKEANFIMANAEIIMYNLGKYNGGSSSVLSEFNTSWAQADSSTVFNLLALGEGYDAVNYFPDYSNSGAYPDRELLVLNAGALIVDDQHQSSVQKHLAGQHDQSSHGSWAQNDGANSSKEKEVLNRLSKINHEQIGNSYFGDAEYTTPNGKIIKLEFRANKEKDSSPEQIAWSKSRNPNWNPDYAKGVIQHIGVEAYYENKSVGQLRASEMRNNRGSHNLTLGTPTGYASIQWTGVDADYQRQGIATAMLLLARKLSPIPVKHSSALSEKGESWASAVKSVFVVVPVSKHYLGQHDQSTHGNWAQGTRLGLTKGGHNLTPREMMDLRKNTSDPLQDTVYLSEALLRENVMGKEHYDELKKQKPEGPKRSDFASHDDYTRAYKQYSKDFTSWAREKEKFIVSDLAKKSLNGTLSGVKKYINTVIYDPWFVENFGDGNQLRSILDIKSTNSMSLKGSYSFGVIVNRNTGREKPFSEFKIDTHSTLSEATLLHEISHYATAISEENPHVAHGVQFAQNFVTLADHYWGAELGSKLKDFYVQEGVLSE